jgi:hypothetical protein
MVSQEETILLLLEALRRPAAIGTPAGESIWSPDQWRSILNCAEDQHVAPLLSYELRRAGADKVVPASVVQRLQESLHANAACNLGLFQELGTVLGGLESMGIPVIVLKGAFLASAVYANPALRRMGDLDLLVHLKDIPQAMEKLSELGYHVNAPPWVNVGCDIELAAPDRLATVELHWGLTGLGKRYSIPVEAVWHSARPVDIAGAAVLTLAPEELLLYLAYHAANKHLFMQGLRSLVDVDQVVRRYEPGISWERVASLAASWGLQRGVSLTIQLCRDYLDTPVPDAGLRRLAVETEPEIIQEAMQRMSMHETAIDVAQANLFYVQAEHGIMAKTRLLLTYVLRLPQRPYARPENEGPWLRAYYIIRRLAYLLGHYIGTLGQLAHLTGTARDSRGQQRLLPWLEA